MIQRQCIESMTIFLLLMSLSLSFDMQTQKIALKSFQKKEIYNRILHPLQPANYHPITKLYEEFQLNTHTADSKSNPKAAYLHNGQFIAIWNSSSDKNGSTWGIYGQKFRSDTSKSEPEFEIHTNTDQHQFSTTISSFPNGQFVVFWDSYSQDWDNLGVYGQLFDDNTSKIGGEFLVNTDSIEQGVGGQESPHSATLENDYVVVVWFKNKLNGNDNGIYSQIFKRHDNGLSPVNAQFYFNTFKHKHIADPNYTSIVKVACLSKDRFAVVYHRKNPFKGFQVMLLLFQFDSLTGTQKHLGYEKIVSKCVEKCEQESFDISAVSDETFIVVWGQYQLRRDVNFLRIYGQLFNTTDGEKVDYVHRISPKPGKGTYKTPNVVRLVGSDKFVVTFSESDTFSVGIVYNKDCTKFGSYFYVYAENPYTYDHSQTAENHSLALASLEDGNKFLIVGQQNELIGQKYMVTWSQKEINLKFMPDDQPHTQIHQQENLIIGTLSTIDANYQLAHHYSIGTTLGLDNHSFRVNGNELIFMEPTNSKKNFQVEVWSTNNGDTISRTFNLDFPNVILPGDDPDAEHVNPPIEGPNPNAEHVNPPIEGPNPYASGNHVNDVPHERTREYQHGPSVDNLTNNGSNEGMSITMIIGIVLCVVVVFLILAGCWLLYNTKKPTAVKLNTTRVEELNINVPVFMAEHDSDKVGLSRKKTDVMSNIDELDTNMLTLEDINKKNGDQGPYNQAIADSHFNARRVTGLDPNLYNDTFEAITPDKSPVKTQTDLKNEKKGKNEEVNDFTPSSIKDLEAYRKQSEHGKKIADISQMLEIPEEYFDIFSGEIMVDPVTVSSGHTYERAYIEDWCSKHGNKDPTTREKLINSTGRMKTNVVIKKSIERFLLGLDASDLKKYESARELVGLWIQKRGRELIEKDFEMSKIVLNYDMSG